MHVHTYHPHLGWYACTNNVWLACTNNSWSVRWCMSIHTIHIKDGMHARTMPDLHARTMPDLFVDACPYIPSTSLDRLRTEPSIMSPKSTTWGSFNFSLHKVSLHQLVTGNNPHRIWKTKGTTFLNPHTSELTLNERANITLQKKNKTRKGKRWAMVIYLLWTNWTFNDIQACSRLLSIRHRRGTALRWLSCPPVHVSSVPVDCASTKAVVNARCRDSSSLPASMSPSSCLVSLPLSSSSSLSTC